MNNDKKKIFIRSFGCQMNVRDSEVICGLLKREGYKITQVHQKADIILFNTCSVRQHAEDKVWSEIGRFKKGQSPKNNSENDLSGTVFKGKETLGTVPFSRHSRALTGTVPIIGIIGCMAQNYKDEIFRRAPQVSFVVGPSDIHKIPEIIKKLLAIRKKGQSPLNSSNSPDGDSPLLQLKIWETDGGFRPEEIYHTGYYQDKEHAYVVISEGCSNFCSYCVVPYVRGALHNRNHKDILKEIGEALESGIKRITLLGQNVNAYQDGDINFIRLMEQVNALGDLEEFSFITSHPRDTSGNLFKSVAELAKLKKYLHLPVQSGSDRILKAMNRGYTRRFYLDLAQNYRKMVKKGALTTDIILGFPSETEEDFKDTYKLVQEIEFDAAYIFKYSPRPHSVALNFNDDVPREEKERRHRLILELQKEISRKKAKKR